MSSFNSKVTTNKPVEEVYAFLKDCNNHEQLQPENIYNWSSTQDEASFTIKNMAKLSLKIEERQENAKIRFVPVGEVPFDVSLNWLMEPTESGTAVTLELNADLNMMMKMVASGPLQKLVDFQTQRLTEVLG